MIERMKGDPLKQALRPFFFVFYELLNCHYVAVYVRFILWVGGIQLLPFDPTRF